MVQYITVNIEDCYSMGMEIQPGEAIGQEMRFSLGHWERIVELLEESREGRQGFVNNEEVEIFASHGEAWISVKCMHEVFQMDSETIQTGQWQSKLLGLLQAEVSQGALQHLTSGVEILRMRNSQEERNSFLLHLRQGSFEEVLGCLGNLTVSVMKLVSQAEERLVSMQVEERCEYMRILCEGGESDVWDENLLRFTSDYRMLQAYEGIGSGVRAGIDGANEILHLLESQGELDGATSEYLHSVLERGVDWPESRLVELEEEERDWVCREE